LPLGAAVCRTRSSSPRAWRGYIIRGGRTALCRRRSHGEVLRSLVHALAPQQQGGAPSACVDGEAGERLLVVQLRRAHRHARHGDTVTIGRFDFRCVHLRAQCRAYRCPRRGSFVRLLEGGGDRGYLGMLGGSSRPWRGCI